MNRLTSISGDAAGDASFVYDANGNLRRESQGGRVFNYEYDARDQLRRVLAGADPIAAFDYDYERRRIARTASGISQSYVYAGNKVIGEYAANAQLMNRYEHGVELIKGELAGEGERFYFGDGLGSITSLAAAGQPPATRYEYDAWGSLIAAGVSANQFGYTGQRLDEETGLMPLGNGERYYSSSLGQFIQQDSWPGVLQSPQSLNHHSYAFNNPLAFTDPSGQMPSTANLTLHPAPDQRDSYKFWQELSQSDSFLESLADFVGKFFYGLGDLITMGGVSRQDRILTQYQRGEISGWEAIKRSGANLAVSAPSIVAAVASGGSSIYLQAIAMGGAAVAERFAVESYEMAYEGRQEYSSIEEYALTGVIGTAVGVAAGAIGRLAGVARPLVLIESRAGVTTVEKALLGVRALPKAGRIMLEQEGRLLSAEVAAVGRVGRRLSGSEAGSIADDLLVPEWIRNGVDKARSLFRSKAAKGGAETGEGGARFIADSRGNILDRANPPYGLPLPDDEIVVIGSTPKPGSFTLRPGVDDLPVGRVIAPGKSASMATDLTVDLRFAHSGTRF